MAKNKKTEIANAEEIVGANVQGEEAGQISDPLAEQEMQQTNEIEEIEKDPESMKLDKTKKTSAEGEAIEEISSREAELMRLYPQYKKLWITPKGFVHPEGAPQYLLKGAKLFKNKYFNNKK